eukprot:4435611-Pyramimonas_sp.AAC.1
MASAACVPPGFLLAIWETMADARNGGRSAARRTVFSRNMFSLPEACEGDEIVDEAIKFMDDDEVFFVAGESPDD